MSAVLQFTGQVKAHNGKWVTSLACPATNDAAVAFVSGARDNTVKTWKVADRNSEEEDYAYPVRSLEGHSGFVQDVALTNNSEYALSASWDRSLRLWNLKDGACFGKFLGHTKDATCVAFSPDNRQVVSGGRDNKLKIWNVKGDCVYTLDKNRHSDWVNCVCFSPAVAEPMFVSGGADHVAKIWSLKDFSCVHTLRGHTNAVTSVTVSPDGSLCASASTDGTARLWDLSRGESLYELECGQHVNQLLFSPSRYWLCVATEASIRIYDLQNKDVVAELAPQPAREGGAVPECLSVAWSADGEKLYSGYTDGIVRVWSVVEKQ